MNREDHLEVHAQKYLTDSYILLWPNRVKNPMKEKKHVSRR
jgi:hypothetical protein